MTTITKLKAALAALESAMRQNSHDMLLTGEELRKGESSITDLRSVIAEMEAGEPVAYVQSNEVHGSRSTFIYRTDNTKHLPDGMKLYTHPQPKADEWNARGSLARLKCWHRLTREESDELVSMQMQWILKTQITQPKAEPDRPVEANKTMAEQEKLTPSQKDAERAAFEQWYVENAFDYERDPLGSKLCGDQWAAWKYRAATPQAKPLPLTQEEIDRCIEAADARWADAFVPVQWARHLAKAIEAAHGIA